MITEEPLLEQDQARGSRPMPEGTESVAVRVRGLVKRYADGTEANRGIDLDVMRGELISILGPNGAGKTTFLRQISTELRPSSGTIEIFQVNTEAEPQRVKQMMGITPQEAGVFESLTVREHFELFGRLKSLSKAEARAATQEVIRALDLVAETGKRVGSLSGGQRRRILIGLALLGQPPLLVLDEPTTGLDPSSRLSVWGVIRRAVTDGTTVILSTHYMEEAERLSDRIGIIAQGRLIAFGTLEELLGRLKKSYRLSYRDPLDPFGKFCVHYFANFNDARTHAAEAQLAEHSIARASLEDVYFTLTGEHFAQEETEGA
jgi:daunorubicin/doxorubicin transport system ATP-binding protein